MPTLLFICTGNYYRSRFAEAVFNFHASSSGSSWKAFSRGLVIQPEVNPGSISTHTLQAMRYRAIPLDATGAEPQSLSAVDLESASLIIALYEREHRPLIRELFPEWENSIRYWSVPDLDGADPTTALSTIEKLVLELLKGLINSTARAETDPCRSGF